MIGSESFIYIRLLMKGETPKIMGKIIYNDKVITKTRGTRDR